MPAPPLSPHTTESSSTLTGPPKPYAIHVPSRYLELTAQKLDNARLPREPASPTAPGAVDDWSRGTPRRVLNELIDYWQENYSWRAEEALLNELPHFRVPILLPGTDTLRIHFLWHQRDAGSSPPPTPVLLVGELWELSKLFTTLRDSSAGYDLVAPSLPGHGHSDGPRSREFGVERTAETLHALMVKLGYRAYVAHGSGELGFSIVRYLAALHPEAVRGVFFTAAHVTARRPFQRLRMSLAPHVPGSYSAAALTAIKTSSALAEAEAAQYRFASNTLAYAVSDSPVGLLAWVAERLHRESKEYSWTLREILTVFMLLWTPGLHGSVLLWDAGKMLGEFEEAGRKRTNVPIGTCSWSGSVPPKDLVATLGPVKTYTKRDGAGRLCAWERPAEVAEDLQEFCQAIWRAAEK